MEIRRILEITDDIAAAVAQLVPQLSPRMAVPTREELQRVAAAPATAFFTAWTEGRMVGMLTLVWYDAVSGRKAWIEDVVTDGAARGCGAGTALVRAALEHARQVGASRVQLTSAPARQAARALYRKEGFSEAETTLFARKTDKEK
ncbi:MAG: GNAT family N-acetyltransferase [Alistipes sp.]|nr:GNAT family N-acetyltransferase [Alistipes sp.]